MARFGDGLTLALAFFALNLHVLHKTRHDLLPLDCEALSLALFAGRYIFRIVSTRSSTVRTDNPSVVSDFVVFSNVQFLKSCSYFKFNTRTSLFLLLAKHVSKFLFFYLPEKVTKHTSKWVWWGIGLVNSLFTASIVFPSLFWVTQSFVGCSNVCELLRSLGVTNIFIWVKFQR